MGTNTLSGGITDAGIAVGAINFTISALPVTLSADHNAQSYTRPRDLRYYSTVIELRQVVSGPEKTLFLRSLTSKFLNDFGKNGGA